MNGAKPIVLLAFANDREGKFLRSLAGEQQAISQALRDAERVPASVKCWSWPMPEWTTSFRSSKPREAGSRFFTTAGMPMARLCCCGLMKREEQNWTLGSFAQFLGQQKGLELVFLNGCATYEQKELLLEAGVKRVIITDQQINDQTAKQFAAQFYESLGTGSRSVVQAFGEASAGTKMKQGGT
jgi:hypothetical protein